MTANNYALVSENETWAGKILNEPEELKVTKNTFMIFISGHGEMPEAYGMCGKFCFYDESGWVPFLIRYPGKIQAGLIVSTPVSALNVFPAIHTLCSNVSLV